MGTAPGDRQLAAGHQGPDPADGAEPEDPRDLGRIDQLRQQLPRPERDRVFVHGTLLRRLLASALVGPRIAAAEIGDQRVDDRLGAPRAVTPREGPEQVIGNRGPVVLPEPRFAEGFKATKEP